MHHDPDDAHTADLSKRNLIKMSAGLLAGAAALASPSGVFAGGATMRVLLVNGSPNEKGCTYTGLLEVAGTLRKEGIDTELFHIGTQPISGCIACYACRNAHIGRCAISDQVNECLEAAKGTDGFIFGTPVHFAAAGGALTSFMDRLFFSADNDVFYLKPAAAVVSARRSGTTSAFDQLNKYFTIKEMPVISSTYWNMIHGSKAEDVKQDAEGLQTLRTLARNMAWFLRCKAAGAQAGVALPQRERPLRTNFIR
ncbi:MAG: flavodoxin family protein [Desulfovibrionaceae bacterium]|nr:flavodoxin family protein [Desulfovibrionaceae bacterium]